MGPMWGIKLRPGAPDVGAGGADEIVDGVKRLALAVADDQFRDR